jgi:TonB dependent receptor
MANLRRPRDQPQGELLVQSVADVLHDGRTTIKSHDQPSSSSAAPCRAEPSSPISATRAARASTPNCGSPPSAWPMSTIPISKPRSRACSSRPQATTRLPISTAASPYSPAAGCPAHQLKVGAAYKVTDKWTLGANLVAASSVYLVGDEANLTAPLPPYATLDLTTSYRPLANVEVFAWARNVTNSWYYNFGTCSPTSSVAIAQVPGATATPSTVLRRRPAYSRVCESPSRVFPAETRSPHPEEAAQRPSRSRGVSPALWSAMSTYLLPILRDASLRDAPQDEVVDRFLRFRRRFRTALLTDFSPRYFA